MNLVALTGNVDEGRPISGNVWKSSNSPKRINLRAARPKHGRQPHSWPNNTTSRAVSRHNLLLFQDGWFTAFIRAVNIAVVGS